MREGRTQQGATNERPERREGEGPGQAPRQSLENMTPTIPSPHIHGVPVPWGGWVRSRPEELCGLRQGPAWRGLACSVWRVRWKPTDKRGGGVGVAARI